MKYCLTFRFKDSCVFHFMTFPSVESAERYININRSDFDMWYLCEVIKRFVL